LLAPVTASTWSRVKENHVAVIAFHNSGKSTLETEDHVLKAEHTDPIKLCLIREYLHMRAHLHTKRHLLTPALKEMRETRAEHLLQWYAKNGHESILLKDEKIFTIEEQYNNQNKKIYAQMSLEVQGGHHPSYAVVWWWGGPIRG